MKTIAKLQCVNHPDVTILVRFNGEWSEYTSSPARKVAGKWVIDEPATYYCIDKEDALATAARLAQDYRDPSVPRRVQFNTGRLYQAHGQIIAATYVPATGATVFSDHSRGIDGTLTLPKHLPPFTLPRSILDAYDRGGYGYAAISAVKVDPSKPVQPL